MNKIAIIIPSRLNAQRLPNKPLKLINNKEMILHVYDLANAFLKVIKSPNISSGEILMSKQNFSLQVCDIAMRYPII